MSKKQFLLQSIGSLDLSVRTVNTLQEDGITTVFQALSLTEKEILKTPNFGRRSVNELKEILHLAGFHLGDTKNFYSQNSDLPNQVDKFLASKNLSDEISVAVPSASDLSWVVALLPEKLKSGVKPEFIKAALNHPEVRQQIQAHLQGIEQTAFQAIQRELGLSK